MVHSFIVMKYELLLRLVDKDWSIPIPVDTIGHTDNKYRYRFPNDPILSVRFSKPTLTDSKKARLRMPKFSKILENSSENV